MSPRLLALLAALCGWSAVGLAALEAPARLWWLAAVGCAGAAAVLWRPVRVLAALAGLAAIVLAVLGRPPGATAVLVGVLLLAYVLLVDLVDDVDRPERSARPPADDGSPPVTPPVAGRILAGWARLVLPVWLAGALAAVSVAVLAAVASRPAPWLVAVAPLLALGAALLAVSRPRSNL